MSKIYKKDRIIFYKLKRKLPKYFTKFPISKNEVSNAILANNFNLRKIVQIVHKKIRKRMNLFLKKNRKKKIVILDIPLLLENKINKKDDVLIFIQSDKKEVSKRLKKRKNFNQKLYSKFKDIQLPLDYKRRKSNFIIKNNFRNNSIKKYVNDILEKIIV